MKHQQSAIRTLILAPVTAATTARTATIWDTKGGDYASIEITLSAGVNTNSTGVVISLKEGDTTVLTNAVTFNSAYATTLGAGTTNTAGNVGILHVDLKGRKRYLLLNLTPDVSTNGAIISSAIGILDPEQRNVANSSNADVVVVG
jgi:hypothetical protein